LPGASQAPALIVISAQAQGVWITEDCALAAENLMLAAFAEGFGTCWIGFAQSSLNTSEGKAALGVPDSWVPIAPIVVGRPRSAQQPVPRREAKYFGSIEDAANRRLESPRR
jgi:nitroreductase